MAICGIAVGPGGESVEARLLSAMAESMALTPAEPGAQHCASPSGLAIVCDTPTTSLWHSDSLIVACDADLYDAHSSPNFPAPSQETARLIGELYLHRGDGFLSELRGVFAIAIWDARTRTLLLARDRFGVKPLCYAALTGQVIFASHPRGIFASNRISKTVDPRALVDYLNLNMVPAPNSVFRGVMKVNPGQCIVWHDGQARNATYWDMAYPEDASAPQQELAEELLSHMERAVRLTSTDLQPQRSGCFLSGGTDSSSVLGLLTRIKGQPASSFSIGFAEARFNELEYAHIAAGHYKSNHHDVILTPQHALDAIPKIVDLYDEPFANSSAIPTYYCAKLAKDSGVDVMLAGDGGDELFGGNERYLTEQIYGFYQRVPKGLRRILEPAVFAAPSVSYFGKAQRYIKRSNTPNPERYCAWRLLQVFPPAQILGAAMPHVNGDLLSAMRRHYESAPAKSELNRLLYVDVKMTLGDEDLPKVVRTAEAAGITVRFPLLDHPLAEFSGRIPANLKVRGLEKRYLFKKATRSLLPEAILRKKKHGFGLPIGFWLKTDPKLRAYSRDVLFDPRTYQRGYFQRPFVEQLIASMETDDTPYYGDLLWVLVMLELWHRRHIEGKAA
jgi:asparagine synthase (glutamine-hydrolysing)